MGLLPLCLLLKVFSLVLVPFPLCSWRITLLFTLALTAQQSAVYALRRAANQLATSARDLQPQACSASEKQPGT